MESKTRHGLFWLVLRGPVGKHSGMNLQDVSAHEGQDGEIQGRDTARGEEQRKHLTLVVVSVCV